MNKQSPKKLFYSSHVLAATMAMVILSGCGANQKGTDQKAANKESITHENTIKITDNSKYLSTFLSLHNQFCEKKYPSPNSLMQTLKTASTLKPADNFEGVYEITINNVSFAVSPEEDGCTTDVMLKGNNKLLFTFEDINEALIKKGYIETGKLVSRTDLGIDQSELTIIEKKYISPSGEVTILNFPLEKKDKYYMTLFAEKFSTEKQKQKQKFFKSLRMASI